MNTRKPHGHMPNPTARFVATILLSFLVIVAPAAAQQCVEAAAMSFDGVDDILTVGTPTPSGVFDFVAPGATAPFTVEAWFRTTFAGGFQPIVQKWGDCSSGATCVGGNTGGWSLGLFNGSPVFSVPSFAIPGQSPPHQSAGVNDGNWHHIRATHVGISGLCNVWVDGQVVLTAGGTPVCFPGGFVGGSFTTNPVTIGGELTTVVNPVPAHFVGEIAEVRIWDTALTSAPSPAERFASLSGNEPNLVGYWRLDDGFSSPLTQTALDLSPSMADGTRGSDTTVESIDPAWTTTDSPPVFATGPGQANGIDARLEINGIGTGTSPGPFVVTAPAGSTLTFSWTGAPNQPCLLLGGTMNVANQVSPLVGSFDIGNPCLANPYSDVVVLLNGFAFPGSLFYTTDAAGNATQSVTLPPALMSNRILLGMQGAMGTTTGFPVRFTAAFQVVIP